MSKKENGGPAFPSGKGAGDMWVSEGGMTLRDYFAAKAMQSLLATITEYPDEHWREGLAMDAYMTADAMLQERSK